MLGWDISMLRPTEPLAGLNDTRLDAMRTEQSVEAVGASDQVASWEASAGGGLDWLDRLAAAGYAHQLLQSGYPSVWVVHAARAIEEAADGIKSGSGPVRDAVPLAELAPTVEKADGWLLITAWDQS